MGSGLGGLRAGTSGARPLWVLALLLVAALASARDVAVVIDPAPSACRVQGRFRAAVPATVAWDVLADYDHIPDFVRSMSVSRSERTADGHLRVHQTANASLFMFHRRMNVVLEIEEMHGRRIVFHDVLGKDFDHYAGEWRIEADSSGTIVHYALEADPKGALPHMMCRGMLRKTAEDLLEQVRAEMTRRAAAGLNSSRPPGPRGPGEHRVLRGPRAVGGGA